MNDYINFQTMINDMKTHAASNGKAIIQNDNPINLKIGYRCENTGKTWSITLYNLRRTFYDLELNGETEKAHIMRDAFSSKEGKESILKLINGN